MVSGKGFHNNTADTLTITWKAANPLSPTRAWFSIPDNVALISVRYFILMTHILPPLHVLRQHPPPHMKEIMTSKINMWQVELPSAAPVGAHL